MERWLPVVGHDRYEVSDAGRVRSLWGRGTSPYPLREPLILKQSPNRAGYLVVGLTGGKTALAHTLVLTAFVGPRPDDKWCCHWDGNPANNRLENLRWDTQEANMLDCKRHGTFRPPPPRRGEDCHLSVLTEDDIRCIRAEPAYYGARTMLARAFGVNAGTIQRIRKGKTWTHVEQHL